MKRFALVFLTCVVCGLFIGCGDGRPQRVPVSGRVTIDGKPLTHGMVRLTTKGSRPSTGKLDSDGRYVLTCFEEGDGAVLGPCMVSIAAIEAIGSNAQRWHAPKKYASPEHSGLTADITEATNSLDFELTWGGGRPFVEQISPGGGE